jgi:hypothetical protein
LQLNERSIFTGPIFEDTFFSNMKIPARTYGKVNITGDVHTTSPTEQKITVTVELTPMRGEKKTGDVQD